MEPHFSQFSLAAIEGHLGESQGHQCVLIHRDDAILSIGHGLHMIL